MWSALPTYILRSRIVEVLEARDNREVQLMIDFDGNIFWQRDLCEGWDLGL